MAKYDFHLLRGVGGVRRGESLDGCIACFLTECLIGYFECLLGCLAQCPDEYSMSALLRASPGALLDALLGASFNTALNTC